MEGGEGQQRGFRREAGADCSLLFCFVSLHSSSACTVTTCLHLSLLPQPWPRSWPFPMTYVPVNVGQPEEP